MSSRLPFRFHPERERRKLAPRPHFFMQESAEQACVSVLRFCLCSGAGRGRCPLHPCQRDLSLWNPFLLPRANSRSLRRGGRGLSPALRFFQAVGWKRRMPTRPGPVCTAREALICFSMNTFPAGKRSFSCLMISCAFSCASPFITAKKASLPSS